MPRTLASRTVTSVLLVLSLAALGPPPAAQQPQATTPSREAMRILVPAYFYPLPGSPWGRMNTMAAAHPGRVAAIGNVNSGPGATLDPTYAATFGSFRASGGLLIGYVSTSYANRPLSSVMTDMGRWTQLYTLDGFFFDELANTAGQHEAYYRTLYNHARSLVPGAFVVGNPGTSTPPSYLAANGQRVTSALCVFETDTNFLAWQADPWVQTRPRHNFYTLPYDVPANTWRAVTDHAYRQNSGWFYTTDDTLANNPWDTLPPYFEALVAYVASRY